MPLTRTRPLTGRTLPFAEVTLQRGPWPLALLLCMAIGVAARDRTPREMADPFDEIYTRGQPLASTLRTLTARFTETSTSTLLENPLVASGTVAVLRPSKILLRYTTPEARTVLIDGDWLSLSWPSRALAQRQHIGPAQRRVERYFVDKSPDQLRSHFTITATPATDRTDTWLVTMVPKRKQISQGVSKIELWIEQAQVMLRAMRITFPNGDTKLMAFEEVTINPVLGADTFKVIAP